MGSQLLPSRTAGAGLLGKNVCRAVLFSQSILKRLVCDQNFFKGLRRHEFWYK